MLSFTPLTAESKPLLLSYQWAMPSKWTFECLPIWQFLMKYFDRKKLWIDPFAGKYSPAHITNDLNLKQNTTYHLDALEFLKQFDDNSVDGIIFDPPYSYNQDLISYYEKGNQLLKEGYKVTRGRYGSHWVSLKKEIIRLLKPNAICLSFGWNSTGLGKKHGFRKLEIVLVNHGSFHYDTICLAEVKGKYQPKAHQLTKFF